MHQSLVYLKMSAKTLWKSPNLQTLASISRDYGNWTKHLDRARNSIVDQMPWISFSAIRFMSKLVKPDMLVFEYGSGGSTIFWAKRTNKVVSVEHDMDWFLRMQNELSRLKITNVEYMLAEAGDDPRTGYKNPGNPDDYISSDAQFQGKSFEDYAKTIDKYPDQFFDIIIVDGRARPSCIKQAIPKLKTKGLLVVDNSEREYYLKSFAFPSSKWEIRKFAGPVPYVMNFSETTILKKLN